MKTRKACRPASLDDKVINISATVLAAIVLLVTLYPLIFVISASFSNPDEIAAGNIVLFPRGWTLDGYALVFEDESIWTGYRNTIFYTISGTALNMFFTLPCAYALSRRDLKGRGLIMKLFTFTMFFSGGMIPTYFAMKSFGFLNTVWAMLFPGLVSVSNLIIARTYFANSIPWDLQEAALMDGCSNTRLLVNVVLPLSGPILAVLTLYYMVGHWNQYFNALIYLTKEELFPLQLFLRNILIVDQSAEMLSGDPEALNDFVYRLRLKQSMQYGLVVVSTLPMLILYPFMQKFFTKGVMLGAIKG